MINKVGCGNYCFLHPVLCKNEYHVELIDDCHSLLGFLSCVRTII